MGEISDALRRARHHRGDAGERRKDQGPLPASDAVAGQVERRADGRESGPVGASLGDSFETRRMSLRADREGEWRARAVVVDGGSATTESFRHLALRMRAELERRSLRCVAITGPLRSEGKTTVACNMALALASVSRGREVALVDLDLRHPSVATDFGIPVEVGVEECILEARPLSEVCVSIEKPAVDVFPAARPHDSAHELLVQPGFATLVRELERRYSTVIFDTPPVLLVPDTSLILKRVRAFVALVRSGETRRRALGSMLELLPSDYLLGTVLNEGPLPTDRRQYRYYAGDSPAPAAQESQAHG